MSTPSGAPNSAPVSTPPDQPDPTAMADAARSWEVVLQGSTTQALSATGVLLWVAGLVLVLLLDAALGGVEPTGLPFLPVAAAAVLVLAAYVALRFAAVRQIASSPPDQASQTRGTDRRPEPQGTVICCSGGGVKSAAFSLGGLQRLAVEGEYQRARAVVGVSGGGYMAGAFATQRARAAQEDRSDALPLAPGSVEVDALRRMTNYLATTGRVRYDLAMSLLLGTAVNVLGVAAVAVVLGWVAGTLSVATGIARAGGASELPWTLDERTTLITLAPVTLVVVVSLAIFVRFGVGGTPLARYGRVVPRAVLGAHPASGRVVDASIVDWSRSLPNELMWFGTLLLAVYPGAPAVATWAHNALPSAVQVFGDLYAQVIAGTGLVGAAAALARSTVKGIRGGAAGNDGALAAALARFRRIVAPRLGVAVIALTAYALLVLVAVYAIAHPDRSFGWWVLLFVVVVWLLMVVAGSANRTSLFAFYRSRLAAAYLEMTQPTDRTLPAAPERAELPTLAQLGVRGPELVLCATANVTTPGVLPSGRGGTPFVMSRSVGFTDPRLPGGVAQVPASEYAAGDPALDIATAIAISGAAVAPVAGRETKTIGSARLLLALFNIRLGVWLPNPHWLQARTALRNRTSWVARLNRRFNQPSPGHVVQEAIRGLSSTLPMVYVTDGGHYDNLGLVEALRRRPARVIVLDGSGDAEDAFPTMGHAIATARMDLGVQIGFDPTSMTRRPGEPLRPPLTGWTRATATFPETRAACAIDYVKCVLPQGLSWDLNSYRLEHPGFPAVTEQLELFDEFDFEAFRQLGWSLVDAAIEADWATPPETT